jgi:hypothetical protein
MWHPKPTYAHSWKFLHQTKLHGRKTALAWTRLEEQSKATDPYFLPLLIPGRGPAEGH